MRVAPPGGGLGIRVHRPICLANEPRLIYGIYELQTLVSALIFTYELVGGVSLVNRRFLIRLAFF